MIKCHTKYIFMDVSSHKSPRKRNQKEFNNSLASMWNPLITLQTKYKQWAENKWHFSYNVSSKNNKFLIQVQRICMASYLSDSCLSDLLCNSWPKSQKYNVRIKSRSIWMSNMVQMYRTQLLNAIISICEIHQQFPKAKLHEGLPIF